MPHIFGFSFLLAHWVPPFKHGKDKMWHQSAIFENSWPQFCQICIIFTCGSRQRDTTSSGWKFRLNNLEVKGLSVCGWCVLGSRWWHHLYVVQSQNVLTVYFTSKQLLPFGFAWHICMRHRSLCASVMTSSASLTLACSVFVEAAACWTWLVPLIMDL